MRSIFETGRRSLVSRANSLHSVRTHGIIPLMRLHVLLIGIVAASFCTAAQESPQTGGSIESNAPIYRSADKFKAPKPKYTPDPKYSAEARAKQLTGTTVLWAVINADGSVGELKVLRPFDPILDQAALDAVKTWTFKPATRNKKPVSVRINIEINHRPQ